MGNDVAKNMTERPQPQFRLGEVGLPARLALNTRELAQGLERERLLAPV